MSLQYHKEKLEENIEGIKGQAAEFKKTYFDEDTEWNEGLGKKAWYPLKKIGELSDHVNDQISLRNQLQIEKGRDLLPGQTWDDAILDYSFKDLRDHTAGGVGNVAGFVTGGNEQVNDAFELGAQILLPDVGDFATGGLGYVDNLGRAAKQLRKFDANSANKLFDQVLNARRFGGELTKLKNSAVQKVEEVTDAVKAPFRTFAGAITGGPRIGAWSDRADMSKQRLEMNVRMAGVGMGFKDGIFSFDDYLKVRKSIPESDRRWFSGIFSTPVEYGTYRRGFQTPKGEEAFKKGLKREFMKTYTPEFLKKYNINEADLQAHHIDALMASLPLYDGVEYLSKEWYHITGTLLSKNVNPGNVPENIKYLVGRRGWPDTPHGITHKYLDEIVGPDGQKFFTKEVRENMRTLKGPYIDAKGIEHGSYREYITKKWADITLKSEQIADQAAGVFAAINADLLHLQPKDIDQIMSSLGKLQSNGLVKPELIKGRWQIGADEIKKVIFDMDFDIEISQYMLNTPQPALSALKDAISSDNPVSAYQAIKAQLPQQLQLFSNTKIKKLNRRYTNPKWNIPDDLPPPRGEGPFPETGEGLDEFGNPL